MKEKLAVLVLLILTGVIVFASDKNSHSVSDTLLNAFPLVALIWTMGLTGLYLADGKPFWFRPITWQGVVIVLLSGSLLLYFLTVLMFVSSR